MCFSEEEKKKIIVTQKKQQIMLDQLKISVENIASYIKLDLTDKIERLEKLQRNGRNK